MQELYFQHYIGGTDDYMKRITKDTKGCGKLSSNNTFFDYIWFRRSLISEGEKYRGIWFLRACEDKSQGIYQLHWKS